MKVIELLTKIANGEEVPKEIIYRGKIYYVEFNDACEKNYYSDAKANLLLERINNVVQLDEKIEIIEEDKKIEKIDRTKPFSTFDVADKVDEIIKVINEMREDK